MWTYNNGRHAYHQRPHQVPTSWEWARTHTYTTPWTTGCVFDGGILNAQDLKWEWAI